MPAPRPARFRYPSGSLGQTRTMSGSCRRIDRKRRRKGEPGLLVRLHLHDVLAEPVLDRVFHRDDVDPFALDRANAGVESGSSSFPRQPVGPVQRMIPCLAGQQPLDRRLFHRHRARANHERQICRLGVQDPDDDLLAVRGRKRRDAEVDRIAPLTSTACAAVLRAKAIRDVEAGDDLDARDQRNAGLARNRHGVTQHAVNAVTHRDRLLARFDVNVARAARDAVCQKNADQLHDRP